MLNRTRRFVLSALPLAALVVMTASGAAASDAARTRANIPFAFDLNGQRFDAGRYIFECKLGSGLITLTPEEGARHAFLGHPLGEHGSAQEPKLVFYKVDDTYYLAELWLAGSGMGKGLPVKKEVAFSAKRGDAKRVVVALSR